MSRDSPPIADNARLTLTQEMLVGLDRAAPGTALGIAATLSFEGPFDPIAFAEAWRRVVARHEPLRSHYRWIGDEPRAVPQPATPARLHRFDLERLGLERLSRDLARLVTWHCARAFDLDRENPARCALVRLAQDRWAWLLGLHHVCADGWSVMVLCKDLSTFYRGLTTGTRDFPAPLRAQCSDVASWQRRWLQGADCEAQLGWWRDYLSRPPIAPLDLPGIGAARPAVQVPMALQTRRMPAELVERLSAARGRERSSTFILGLSALVLLLSRWSRQRDILVGTLMANRLHPGSGEVLGAHYNTVLVRARLGDAPSVGELLDQVTESCREVFERQGVPFARVAKMVERELGLESRSLLRVMFMHDELPAAHLDLAGVEARTLDWSKRGLRELLDPASGPPAGASDPITRNTMASSAELAFYVREDRTGLEVWAFYKMDLFPDELARWLLDSYLAIFEGLIEHLAADGER